MGETSFVLLCLPFGLPKYNSVLIGCQVFYEKIFIFFFGGIDMSFYEKLEQLCKNNGITVTSLANELGYSSSAGTTWKKSKGLPRNSTLKKVSDYFGVPIAYFTDDNSVSAHTVIDNHGVIGHTHAPVTIINGTEKSLSEQEIALLKLFEGLDVVKQARLLAFASDLKNEV
jgi:transcriptional regulator with XRE-family HTH domain